MLASTERIDISEIDSGKVSIFFLSQSRLVPYVVEILVEWHARVSLPVPDALKISLKF